MSAGNWRVGQEVILREFLHRNGYRDSPATIARVGRSYIYVEQYGREIAFHADTGYQKTEYSARLRVATPEMLAEEDRRLAAERRLEDVMRWNWKQHIPVEVLEKIADLIEESR